MFGIIKFILFFTIIAIYIYIIKYTYTSSSILFITCEDMKTKTNRRAKGVSNLFEK